MLTCPMFEEVLAPFHNRIILFYLQKPKKHATSGNKDGVVAL